MPLGLPRLPETAADVARAQRIEELLADAEQAAEESRHSDAVVAALAALELDSSLEPEIELLVADQLTWMERSEEALPWYRKHLERHPDDRDAVLGLARALAWSDDLLAADEIYARVVAEDPADEEALLGLARVTAWREDHAEAAHLYARVLETAPDSREALLGLAAAENARGRHRQAATHYEELLERDRTDAEARTGLAQAWYWQGRPDLGQHMLEGVDGSEATKLRHELEADRRAVWEAAGSFWTDGDDEDITTWGVRAEGAPAPRFRLRGELAFDRAEQPGPGEIRAVRTTGGGSWAASHSVALNLDLTVLTQESGQRDVDAGDGTTIPGDEVESTRLLWDGWATWRPADWTRLDGGLARVHITTPRALARRLYIDQFSFGLDRRINDRLIARTEAGYGDYSDGNARWAASGELDLTPWPWRPISFGAGVSWFTFDQTFDHGYYNPDRYDALFVRAGAAWAVGTEWRFAGDARLASEHEDGDGRFGVLDGGVEVRWRPWPDYGFFAFARKSTSRFDTSDGYEREGVGLALFAGT
jgi:tetratricopeptide (TPR) repeat protein